MANPIQNEEKSLINENGMVRMHCEILSVNTRTFDTFLDRVKRKFSELPVLSLFLKFEPLELYFGYNGIFDLLIVVSKLYLLKKHQMSSNIDSNMLSSGSFRTFFDEKYLRNLKIQRSSFPNHRYIDEGDLIIDAFRSSKCSFGSRKPSNF